MGGKSSSSSSNQTTTIQTDERIAATDSATVTTLDGNNNILTDHGAIDKAGELTFEAINTLGQIALQSLTQTSSAVDVLGRSTDSAFEFVDDQNRDEENRTLETIVPYLMAGVAVIALSGGLKLK